MRGGERGVILAGDIGGTKTVLSLWESTDAGLEERAQRSFASAEYHSAEEVLDRFLAEHPPLELDAAAFGVAGPVIGGRVTATNLPWQTVDATALGRRLGVQVTLLNDLEAAAYGMLALPAARLAALNPGADAVRPGNAAVIAAGTGLGEAFLVWDGERHRAMAGEGGHADFAPRTEEEVELLRFLRGRLGGRVSWERVLSGPGLVELYHFARKCSGEPEPDWLAGRLAADDPGAVVSQLGLEKGDSACVHALELFASIYGAEAGNMAVRCLALGGVFLGGGIAPKILPALRAGRFMEAFCDKGRFAGLLHRIPVQVALDERAPLIGAASVARERLDS